MTTNFPVSLDTFTDPAGSDVLGTVGAKLHSTQHRNVNDAVAALETKVGINGSADTNSLDYKIAHAGGGAFPDSALGTTASGTITLTDQYQTIAWDNPPDTIVGSDMAMSDDSLSLVFVTGGFYQVVTWLELRPSADASGWVWIQLVPTFMTDPFFNVGSLFEVPIRPESQEPFLTAAPPQPPYKVSAGEKLSIRSLMGLSAGSVAVSSNSLLFARKIA